MSRISAGAMFRECSRNGCGSHKRIVCSTPLASPTSSSFREKTSALLDSYWQSLAFHSSGTGDSPNLIKLASNSSDSDCGTVVATSVLHRRPKTVPTGIVASFSDSFWTMTVNLLTSTALLGITIDCNSIPAGRVFVVEASTINMSFGSGCCSSTLQMALELPPASSSREPGFSHFTQTLSSSSSFSNSVILVSRSLSRTVYS